MVGPRPRVLLTLPLRRPLVFTRVTGAEDDRLKWYGWTQLVVTTLRRGPSVVFSLNSRVSSLAVVPQPLLWHLNWLPSVQSEGDCIHECRDAYPVVETHKRLDGVAQNNAGEFPCISARSTVTGTKGEEYSSCVGVCSTTVRPQIAL